MPGTGHSARYKGSISNRSKISPFEHLAKWNQQLLGADGAVPSIVGGNSLEFKKLDASNIAGVMHNPAIANLNMNCLNIIQIGELRLCNGGRIDSQPISGTDTMRIDSENKELLITNSSYNTTGANMIKIRPGDAALGTAGGTIQLEFFANQRDHTVNIGNNMDQTGAQGIINIGVVGSTAGLTFVNIGSAGLDKVDIKSGSSELKLQAGVSTLKGSEIQIGDTSGNLLGFLGAAPSLRSTYGAIGGALPNPGANLSDVINKINLIRNALVTVGLCQG